MAKAVPLRIDYFSDLLCIWAYAAQARIEEVYRCFPGQVTLVERFCPVFGDTVARIGEGWRERGGYTAFNAHLREVSAGFDHLVLDPDVWLTVRPITSASGHLYVKAAQLAEQRLDLAPADAQMPSARLSWGLRLAFFRDARDIARRDVLDDVAGGLGLAVSEIDQEMTSGRAFAALSADFEARDRLRVEGSPTFILDDGRQKLYGNVGYRVIEANIQELLRTPDAGAASWC